ncbi:MAG: hypothetical protein KF799_13375 [Bdellovibrionales bacterium]|nr:hypothetical protein [Bdellovibrionales bacterium]
MTSIFRTLIALMFAFNFSFANAEIKFPEKPKGLTSEQVKTLRQARLQAYIDHFNHEVKSGADIEPKLLSGLIKPKYLEELRPIFKSLGTAPKLVRDDETLVVKMPDKDYRIEFREKNQVKVNGELWTFDPTSPWLPQMAILEKKLGIRKTALFSILLPDADAALPAIPAIVWICGILGPLLVSNLGNNALERAGQGTCWLLSLTGWRPWNGPGWCTEWKKNKDEQNRLAALEAAKNKKSSPNRDWVPRRPECPKGEYYTAQMKEVEGNKSNSDWFRFSAKTKASKITAAYIFDDKPETINDPEKEAIIKFVYDEDTPPNLVSLQFRNDRFRKGDPWSTEYTSFYFTDDPTQIPPQFRDVAPKLAAFAESAQVWVDTCAQMAKAAQWDRPEAEASAQKMMEQPVAPVPLTPKPPVVPVSKEVPVSQ